MALNKRTINVLASDVVVVAATPSGNRIQEWNKVSGTATSMLLAIQTDMLNAGIALTSIKKSLELGVKAGLPGFVRELECYQSLSDKKKASALTMWNRLYKVTPDAAEGEDGSEGEGEGSEGSSDPKLGVVEVLLKAARKGLKAEMSLEQFVQAASLAYAESLAAQK